MKINNMIMLAAVGTAVCAYGDPNDPQIHVTAISQTDSARVIVTYTLDEPAIVTMDVLTNGVSIGGRNVDFVAGDCNRLVTPDKDNGQTVSWAASKSWPNQRFDEPVLSVKLTAWATNAPPDYMVVDLVAHNTVRYYESAEFLPGGMGATNPVYKTDKLLLRRIHATNVEWTMGAPVSESSTYWTAAETAHSVTLTEDFYMGVFPVTQRQYYRIDASEPESFKEYDDSWFHPCQGVSWRALRGPTAGLNWPNEDRAVAHGVDASFILGTIRSLSGVDFDLPTSAQWEFACRAGTTSAFNDGTDAGSSMPRLGWCKADSQSRTHAVGERAPNEWGLYDMHGNVSEWCLDYYNDKDSYFGPTARVDPEGSSSSSASRSGGNGRIVRGGHWNVVAERCRSAYIDYELDNARENTVGFRVCCPVTLKW